MVLVRELAEHLVGIDASGLPSEVVEQAKRCVLDCLGNLLAGRYAKQSELVLAYASRWSDKPEATIAGYMKTSKEAAAFANAALTRMYDLDDGFRVAFGHPGCVLVPVALAVGEVVGASGLDVLAALVAGYDVHDGLGRVINPSSYQEKGFDATGVCGAVAAAAVAARLYGFDAVKMKNALGIAALHAGGTIQYQNDGTMGKILCPGWSASTGIRAADLANLGFTGPEAVFEGKQGFFQAFSNAYDPARLTARLGTEYGIQQNYFKLHGCMRGLHCTIDAILSLRATHGLSCDNVQRITVKCSAHLKRLDQPHPETVIGGQCSLPFSVAVAIKHGEVSKASLTRGIGDPEIRALEDKVEVLVDATIEEYWKSNPDNYWAAVDVEVLTRDGARAWEWAPVPSGEPENPLTQERLLAKFTQLVSPTPFAPDVDALAAAIEGLDGLPEIGRFTAQLRAHAD